MANTPLTFGSLFAGIGGFDLGLGRAGMVCKWQVEIDEYANSVLAKHWPNVPRHGDVRTFPSAEGDWNVDVICGGFPCTDISSAGAKAGIEGEQSSLWREFARIIGELRPRYVVVENVSALFARGMGDVLRDLAGCGYDAEWQSIPAGLAGAPHLRARVWLVGYTDCHSQPILPSHAEAPWLRQAWPSDPDPMGVDDGLPYRTHRLRCLGNAVVPAIPEFIGRCIAQADQRLTNATSTACAQ